MRITFPSGMSGRGGEMEDLLIFVSVIMVATTFFNLSRLLIGEIRLRLIKEEDARYYWNQQSLWRYR